MKKWLDYERGEDNKKSGKDEMDKENEAESSDSEIIPAQTLLPSVKLATNALIVSQERHDLYGHILFGYSEAIKRVHGLYPPPSHFIERQSTNLPALLEKSQEVALAFNQDALEEARIKLGLDKLRKKLLNRLRGKLSWTKGLKMLSKWTDEHLRKTCKTIKAANELFPNLTLFELSFFPLLRRVPSTFLLYGTQFDSKKFAGEIKENIAPNAHRRVPRQIWATTHGICYALDDYHPEYNDKGIYEDDPYQVLGMTGIEEEVELVEFEPGVQRIIQALIPLFVSNSRLYERVWYSSPESLQVGFGRIAILALERIAGKEMAQVALANLNLAIESLPPEIRKKFETDRKTLEQNIVRASIYDGSKNTLLRPDEIIRLVGILETVPRCLIGEKPFTGVIQPYGATVRFISMQSKIVEEYHLSPTHGREAAISIQTELEDAGRENRTLMKIFHELCSFVQTRIITAAQEKNTRVSRLESTALRLWMEQGIVLCILPTWQIEPMRDFKELGIRLTGKDLVVNLTTKIGLDEARQISLALHLLPRPLLQNVRRVQKTSTTINLDTMTSGMFTQGTYDPETKTIAVVEAENLPYPDQPPKIQVIRSFTILHECGEAIWHTLSDEDKHKWKRISWTQPKKQRKDKHFLTFYSHYKDEKEDFCDHFACFVLHGPEFRAMASNARQLGRKYRAIRKIISSLIGSRLEYPRFFPWPLREIHGGLYQKLKTMELKEAIEFEELRAKEIREENLEYVYEIRKSFEELLSQAEQKATAEDKDYKDPVERQIAEKDEDEEEIEAPIETKAGFIEIHEIREYVADILEQERVLDRDDRSFHKLLDHITKALLDEEWGDIKKALDFLDNDEIKEILELLHDIDISPKNF